MRPRPSDGAELKPFHLERKAQVSDLRRCRILKAEAELRALEIITEHLEISQVGRTRIDDALREIYRALQLERRKVGLGTVTWPS